MIPAGKDTPRGADDIAGRIQGLDTWPTGEILEALWTSQSRAMAACRSAMPALHRAIEGSAARLASGTGRLVYAGAGSAGMLAAVDALELGGTYNWPEDRLAIYLAGGLDFRREPDAAVEDDSAGARAQVREARLGPADVVVGVSASGASAYTVAIVEEARSAGAMTVAVAGQADSPLARAADHPVVVATGAEVILGSTRLAAGTAQKLVLNLFSTAVMVRLGAVYDNFMIDLRPMNTKLRQRQAAIVASIAEVELAVAVDALARHGDAKRAVLGLAGLLDPEIEAALTSAGGNLRVALQRTRGRREP
jgi:N-acetylmuramic acid 6-phosphate etherase